MKKILAGFLAVLLLVSLWGCTGKTAEEETAVPETTTEPTVPATVPQDGNPDDVTCKGTYTGEGSADAVVAAVGDTKLTNRDLSAWYWAQAALYRQNGGEDGPDFSKPLDTQVCTVDDSVGSWQQYFLRQALNAWHSAAAMELQSQKDGQPVDETYKPVVANHEKYMTGMPATSVLHGYNNPYQPNSLHRAYLEQIPELLAALAKEQGYADAAELAEAAFGTTEEALAEFIRLYNFGYFYFVQLGYDIALTEEEVQARFAENAQQYAARGITETSGYTVNIRHLLLTREEGEDEAAYQERVEKYLKQWDKKYKKSEAIFADMAHLDSQDTGVALNGGSYIGLRPGQLPEEMDSWCFDPARVPGDYTAITSDQGCHLIYFSGKTDDWYTCAEADAQYQARMELLSASRERFPAEIHYDAIVLPEARAQVSMADVLYPDIAHQRFPEVPLYLQQDYPGTRYGGYELRTHGCGITTMSMLASYLADDELTPPEMCARYGRYSYENGTDGMIFINEPPVMGFYLREKTYEPRIAKQALQEGHIVISVQHKGYWTTGGHYLLLERITEDDMVQVRDSNIFNYSRVPTHINDLHPWKNITSAGSGYWIYEYKITSIPACSRCGEPEKTNSLPDSEYICERCTPALLRRNAWLEPSV